MSLIEQIGEDYTKYHNIVDVVALAGCNGLTLEEGGKRIHEGVLYELENGNEKINGETNQVRETQAIYISMHSLQKDIEHYNKLK